MTKRRLTLSSHLFLLVLLFFTITVLVLNYRLAYPVVNQPSVLISSFSNDCSSERETHFALTTPLDQTQVSTVSKAENQNDISTGEIICFLHRRTAHIQLNIEFVGTNNTNSSLLTLPQKDPQSENTTLESIIIAGTVRDVTIIEANNYTLQHTEIDLNGSTKIQFALTKPIPIGFTRTIRINFIQETTQVETLFYYQLGIDWLRRIGSQKTRIIFDQGLSLINSMPKPHVISSIGGRLVLSWFEVNSMSFSVEIDFSAPIVLDDLIISPAEWSLGTIPRNKKGIEQVFQVINNENSFLDGTISAPDWIELNVSHWSLAVGEQLYFKAIIHPNTLGEVNGNITLQSNLNAYPITVKVTGQIIPAFNLKVILSITFVALALIATVFTLVILARKGKISVKILNAKTKKRTESETAPPLEAIDLSKWKELLTTKEFLIFEEISKSNGISQAEICRRTQLSKSTISRCVNRLVVKGLVKKESYGMSNRISLNLAFFKEEQ